MPVTKFWVILRKHRAFSVPVVLTHSRVKHHGVMLTWTAKQPHDRPPMTIGSSFLGRSSTWNCGERLNVTIAMKAFQLKNDVLSYVKHTQRGNGYWWPVIVALYFNYESLWVTCWTSHPVNLDGFWLVLMSSIKMLQKWSQQHCLPQSSFS